MKTHFINKIGITIIIFMLLSAWTNIRQPQQWTKMLAATTTQTDDYKYTYTRNSNTTSTQTIQQPFTIKSGSATTIILSGDAHNIQAATEQKNNPFH